MPFTWTNKHRDHTVIFEKLDRACANTNWLSAFPDTEVENLPIYGSDHGPICVSFSHKNSITPRPFKFEAIWIGHESFRNLVHNSWNDNLNMAPISDL